MDEKTFVRELERRADDVRPTPLTFDAVRGRAVRIRRRRRAAVGVAAAAAVAAVAVVPSLLGSERPRTAPDPAPPTAPGASVLHDGTLTFPDGGTVDLDVDNEDVTQLGVLTDGRIVLAMSDPYVIRVYDADGTLAQDYRPQTNALTMSADDDAVAWIADDFTVRVLASGVDEPARLPGIPMPGEAVGSIDAVLAPDHLLVGDWNTTTGEITATGGHRELATSEPLRVTDVSPDGRLWAVRYDDDDPQFGCSGLYDPEARAMVARSCETAGLRFSPDGQHLLGMRGDNNMFGEATTYDLELHEVGRFESEGEGHVISRAGWADADHLLVAETNWRDSTWTLVRVDVDWSDRQVVVPERAGGNPETTAEFLLSE